MPTPFSNPCSTKAILPKIGTPYWKHAWNWPQADPGPTDIRPKSSFQASILHFDVFHLDPVDIDDAPAHPDPPIEPFRRAFVDKAKPPAQAVIAAQDRRARAGFDHSDMESR
jgi:hypothetical protein